MRKKKDYTIADWKDTTFCTKYVTLAWMLIPIVIILWVLRLTCVDSDSYFLMATGRYIVENGEVPKINPFVIHSDLAIIVQQWILDVINYLLYDNFGINGMYIWSVLAISIACLIEYKYLGMYSTNNKAKIYTVMISIFILYGFYSTRPTSVTVSILLTELTILEMVNKGKSKRLLWVLPLLSLILINCHSAMWPMLFIMMLPYVFPPLTSFKSISKIKEHLWKYKEMWFMMVPIFLVGFLNPNGIRGMLYLIYSYSSADSKGTINEMMSAQVFSYLGIITVVSLVIIAIWAYKNRSNLDWKNLYLALGTWILAAKNMRSTWMIVLGTSPLLIMLLDEIIKNKVKLKHTNSNYRILALIYTFGAVSIFLIIFPGMTPRNTVDSQLSPVKAVEYLDDLSDSEKENMVLFTGFNNGAYLEWNGYKVYMDARPEIYCKNINGKEDIYDEYLEVLNGEIDFNEFLNKYQFTHLVVYETVFQTYLECNDNYEIVVDADEYKVFKKV